MDCGSASLIDKESKRLGRTPTTCVQRFTMHLFCYMYQGKLQGNGNIKWDYWVFFPIFLNWRITAKKTCTEISTFSPQPHSFAHILLLYNGGSMWLGYQTPFHTSFPDYTLLVQAIRALSAGQEKLEKWKSEQTLQNICVADFSKTKKRSKGSFLIELLADCLDILCGNYMKTIV